MKKNLFLVGALLCATVCVNAQVVTGTIGNGTFVDWSGYSSTEYGLDFNNDGTLEFALKSAETETPSTNCAIQWTWSENGNNVVTAGTLDSGGWDEVSPIQAGNAIGANSNWGGEGDAYIVNYYGDVMLPVNQDCYLGFKIKLGTNVHYGWAKVKLTGNASAGYNATWSQIAYNTTPNASINAGQTGVGIASYDNVKISVYPNPATSVLNITSETQFESVEIYNVNGQCCLRASLENNSINVETLESGSYFARLISKDGAAVVKFVK